MTADAEFVIEKLAKNHDLSPFDCGNEARALAQALRVGNV